MENFWSFMMIYGTLSPLCLGIMFIIPIHCGWAHFPNKKGRVTGIITTAFGLACTVFNSVATGLANPNNLSPTIIV